jgi:hypothetical protein
MSDQPSAPRRVASIAKVGVGRAEVRPAMESDLDAVLRIYVPNVRDGTGSFEEEPPDIAELASRRAAVVERGLRFLVAEAPRGVLGSLTRRPSGLAPPIASLSKTRCMFTLARSAWASADCC